MTELEKYKMALNYVKSSYYATCGYGFDKVPNVFELDQNIQMILTEGREMTKDEWEKITKDMLGL